MKTLKKLKELKKSKNNITNNNKSKNTILQKPVARKLGQTGSNFNKQQKDIGKNKNPIIVINNNNGVNNNNFRPTKLPELPFSMNIRNAFNEYQNINLKKQGHDKELNDIINIIQMKQKDKIKPGQIEATKNKKEAKDKTKKNKIQINALNIGLTKNNQQEKNKKEKDEIVAKNNDLNASKVSEFFFNEENCFQECIKESNNLHLKDSIELLSLNEKIKESSNNFMNNNNSIFDSVKMIFENQNEYNEIDFKDLGKVYIYDDDSNNNNNNNEENKIKENNEENKIKDKQETALLSNNVNEYKNINKFNKKVFLKKMPINNNMIINNMNGNNIFNWTYGNGKLLNAKNGFFNNQQDLCLKTINKNNNLNQINKNSVNNNHQDDKKVEKKKKLKKNKQKKQINYFNNQTGLPLINNLGQVMPLEQKGFWFDNFVLNKNNMNFIPIGSNQINNLRIDSNIVGKNVNIENKNPVNNNHQDDKKVEKKKKLKKNKQKKQINYFNNQTGLPLINNLGQVMPLGQLGLNNNGNLRLRQGNFMPLGQANSFFNKLDIPFIRKINNKKITNKDKTKNNLGK